MKEERLKPQWLFGLPLSELDEEEGSEGARSGKYVRGVRLRF